MYIVDNTFPAFSKMRISSDAIYKKKLLRYFYKWKFQQIVFLLIYSKNMRFCQIHVLLMKTLFNIIYKIVILTVEDQVLLKTFHEVY